MFGLSEYELLNDPRYSVEDERAMNGIRWAGEILEPLKPDQMPDADWEHVKTAVKQYVTELTVNNRSIRIIGLQGRMAAMFLIDEMPHGKLRNWIPHDTSTDNLILRIAWRDKLRDVYRSKFPMFSGES